jgi:hypothetical protein
VRPDGPGIFADGQQTAGFFLEYDVGGERLGVLVDKVARYAAHAAEGGARWPVLFWLPAAARERHLHRILGDERLPVPVATAARDSLQAGQSVADAIWLVHGQADAPRRLTDLASLGEAADPQALEALSQRGRRR